MMPGFDQVLPLEPGRLLVVPALPLPGRESRESVLSVELLQLRATQQRAAVEKRRAGRRVRREDDMVRCLTS